MDKQQRLQAWTARITDFKSSGLTMSSWCEVHNQTIHQLKYWLRKLSHSPSSSAISSSYPCFISVEAFSIFHFVGSRRTSRN
jgi:hypothetical protein